MKHANCLRTALGTNVSLIVLICLIVLACGLPDHIHAQVLPAVRGTKVSFTESGVFGESKAELLYIPARDRIVSVVGGTVVEFTNGATPDPYLPPVNLQSTRLYPGWLSLLDANNVIVSIFLGEGAMLVRYDGTDCVKIPSHRESGNFQAPEPMFYAFPDFGIVERHAFGISIVDSTYIYCGDGTHRVLIRSIRAPEFFSPRRGMGAAPAADGAFAEFQSCDTSAPLRMPFRTTDVRQYLRISENHLVGIGYDSIQQRQVLRTSVNNGSSWFTFDTLDLGNEQIVKPSRVSYLRRVGDCIYASINVGDTAMIVSSLDTGQTWKYVVEGRFYSPVLTTMDGDPFSIVSGRSLYELRADGRATKINTGDIPASICASQFQAGQVIALTGFGLIFSNDDVSAWYEFPFSEANELEPQSGELESSTGYRTVPFVDVEVLNADTILTMGHTQRALCYDEGKQLWRIEPKYRVPSMAPVFIGDTIERLARGFTIPLFRQNGDVIQLGGQQTAELECRHLDTVEGIDVPGVGDVTAVAITDDSVIVVSRSYDSTRISTNNGQTWTTIIGPEKPSFELPVCVGDVERAADGSLIIGFLGYGRVGTDSTRPAEGGIWRSVDGGQTWQKSSGLGVDEFVWSLCRSSSGALIANVSDIRANNPSEGGGNRRFVAITCRIYRSTDNGQTWVRVHDDPVFGGTIHLGRRSVVMGPSGEIVTCGWSSGVLRSLDDGLTWATVADDGLLGSDIARDVAVLRNGRIVVGSDRGATIIGEPTTSIDVVEPVPYFDLGVTPNPVQENVRLTLYNSTRAGAPLSDLAIYDLNGNIVRNLNDQLNGATTNARHTVDVNVSDLPTGIYIATVRGKRRISRTFMIAR